MLNCFDSRISFVTPKHFTVIVLRSFLFYSVCVELIQASGPQTYVAPHAVHRGETAPPIQKVMIKISCFSDTGPNRRGTKSLRCNSDVNNGGGRQHRRRRGQRTMAAYLVAVLGGRQLRRNMHISRNSRNINRTEPLRRLVMRLGLEARREYDAFVILTATAKILGRRSR